MVSMALEGAGVMSGRRAMLAHWQRWLASSRAARAALGDDAAAPLVLEPATEGLRSLVYFVRGEAHRTPCAVLRVFEERRLARRHLWALARLRAAGLEAPVALCAATNPWTRWRWGGYVLLETYVRGVAFDRVSDRCEAAARVGVAFARLHANAARWGGWPWQRPALDLRRRVRKGLGRLAAREPAFARALAARFRLEDGGVWAQARRLVFGDIAPNNLLLEPAGPPRFVDVSGAGHMVAGDKNDVFTDAVVEFLATA